jgi:hypothetical protein
MSEPEAIMADQRRAEWLWFIVAGLFILAGLRDLFLPGFLSISGHARAGGWWTVGAGLLILAMAVIRSLRDARARSH